MAGQTISIDFSVTPEKVAELLRRIIETANPLQIIAFGSRARGDHRPDSDLDLAVILDAPEEKVHRILRQDVLLDLNIDVDLVPVSEQKYKLHSPWRNSIFNHIHQEGVVLYDRQHPQSANAHAVHSSPGGRIYTSVSAA